MISIFEKPNTLLRLEGLAVFTLALAFYWHLSLSWMLFWSCILLPDLAILGYLVSARVGAVTYNITHAKLLPAMLIAISMIIHNVSLLSFALVWLVHIGLDRSLGYGLKYPGGFKLTHLGVIGQVANMSPGRFMPCGK